MAIDVAGTGHTLLWHALAQNDVDMQHFKLLNLDTSNLQELGAPPTIHPPGNQWLQGWDNPTHAWTVKQPGFVDLAGQLTLGVNGQQRHITELGTIAVGTWQGGIISGTYLAKLDQIRQPGADVSMANKRLINLANPINAQDAVTKSFMDMLLQGLNPKTAVRLASTTFHSHVGLHAVDGIVPRAGDRILLKDQVGRESENTIWIAQSGAWTVSPDMDTFDEVNRAYCTVREGNANAGTSWVQVSPQAANGDPKSWILFAVIGAGGDPGPPGPGVPAGGATDDVLVKNSPDDYDTKWVAVPGVTPPNYGILQTARQDTVVGTTSAAFKMMGLGANALITLLTSGKFAGTVNGWMWNNNAAGSVIAQLRMGNGAAPHNGDNPPVGSIAVGGYAGCTRLAANALVPFSLSWSFGGATINNPIWIDIALATSGGIGTANIGAVSVNAFEIP